MLLLIDNFDSFTFNIAHAIQRQNIDVCIKRNNRITLTECLAIKPDYLVIGPGPGTPKDSGICADLIKHYMEQIPILGICLGMQLIAEIFGGSVIKSTNGPMHGKTSRIIHNDTGVFSNLPQEFTATRYNSLIVDRASIPLCLDVTAETKEGEIMGLCHKSYPIEGVQFHPESILTQKGDQLFNNYLHSNVNPQQGLLTC